MLTQSATAKQEAGNKPETGLILDLGIPTLLPEWRKMFAPSTVVTDVTAGITVGCVAVPLWRYIVGFAGTDAGEEAGAQGRDTGLSRTDIPPRAGGDGARRAGIFGPAVWQTPGHTADPPAEP